MRFLHRGRREKDMINILLLLAPLSVEAFGGISPGAPPLLMRGGLGVSRRGAVRGLAVGLMRRERRGAWAARCGMADGPPLLSFAIAPDDQWALWAVVSVAALVGIRSEETAVGRALSGAVVSMLFGATLAVLGVLPVGPAPPIAGLQSLVVSIATPLLLLSADLTVILKKTGRMLLAFACGALGTTVGTLLGFWLVSQPLCESLGSAGWKTGAALMAKNIGGGLNFMGVANTLNIDSAAVTSALAVDNLLGLLYFPLCGYLCRFVPSHEVAPVAENDALDSAGPKLPDAGGLGTHTLQSLAGALCAGTVIAAVASKLGAAMAVAPQTISVLLAVLLGTLFSSRLVDIARTGDLVGTMMMYLFFASVGASTGGAVSTLGSSTATYLLAFDSIVYVCHVVVILLLGRILKVPLSDTLLASNANIGNPATAAALARTRGWQGKVLPAMLSGTAGNIVATTLGLVVGRHVLLPIALPYL